MFTNILYVFLLKSVVVTNILKTSGIQFAFPLDSNPLSMHVKKKRKQIESRNKKKKLESFSEAIN